MNTARQLAEHLHALRADALPGEAREAALRCVLDLLCAAAAGFADPAAAAARRASMAFHGPGESVLWFAGRSAGAPAALLANSTAAAALDLDDGNRQARGHPGAAVIPAVWAMLPALHEGADAVDELLAAIVTGYEAGVRMATGRLAYAPTGAWAPYAVIAAAGRLERVSAEVMAQAFAIAAQCAPALPGLAGRMGSDVKEGIPWGCTTGLMALQLAKEGWTGPLQIFDEPGLFAAERMVDGLGGAAWITRTYHKPYACCRHAHAPLDAALTVMARHGIAAADVTAVTVHTYCATFNLANLPRPRTLVEAQYSVPFCVAAGLVRGAHALLPMESALLEDAEVLAFAGRVAVEFDPAIEPLFPARSPARVTITTKAGTYRSDLTDPRGDPHNPLSWDALEAKFRTATRKAMGPGRQEAILAGVRRLRAGELAPLQAALRAPLDP